MHKRTQRALVTAIALAAMFIVLAAPMSHEHLGKPGSVCHVCSAVQALALVAGLLPAGLALRPVETPGMVGPHRPNSWVGSRRTPRAPPA